ncbi:MAG: adenylate/guanylate cyclase domain-containing protein [Acidimicrobiales bacterium]
MRAPRLRRHRTSFGSRLLGTPDESPRRRRVRVQVLLTGSIVTANLIGGVGVAALVALLVPDEGPADWQTIAAGAVYLAVAVVVGLVWGTRTGLGSLRWVLEDREPDAGEQRRTLRVPLRLLRVQAVLWLGAAVLFAVLNRDLSSAGGVKVGLTVLLGGIVTCAIAYLLSEFAMRPVAARALAAGAPDRLLVPGVTARSLLAWVTGSGIPVLGLLIGATFALTDDEITAARLAAIVLTLGGVALVSGLLLTLLAIRATVDPITSVRVGLARVEQGDLDAHVPVYDGTEVGLLQAGFNDMVGGLRERERIRDLFERHVGQDVAREAITREAALGGEVREVAVLFADVVGSTQMAAERPPTEVVLLLNRFFSVVVDVVTAHEGLVNKLVGDAVLAVWGAPTDCDDAAGRALAAARDLSRRLEHEVPDLAAGVGVAAGEVVAGNVGDERRFEYTVIGDPVNEAARLTELSKSVPGRVVASMAAVDRAAPAEARCWQAGEEVTLRGRRRPTVVATPVNRA